MLRRFGWLFLFITFLLAIWLMNVSRPGQYIEGCYRDCSNYEETTDGHLRVMSLNVLHGFPDFKDLDQRLDLIVGEINRHQVNLALLQEVPWTRGTGNGAKFISSETGMNYVYLRANGNRNAIFFEEGLAVLSRYPLEDSTFIELKPQAGFFEHRVVLRVVLEMPGGDLAVFVTHLTNGDPQTNRDQVAALKAFVQSQQTTPALIAGDFNATPDSHQIQSIRTEWIDTYALTNPGDPGLTCCVEDLAHGPVEPLEKRIDYLFLLPAEDRSLEVQNVVRIFTKPFRLLDGWQWASDHIGLLADIKSRGAR